MLQFDSSLAGPARVWRGQWKLLFRFDIHVETPDAGHGADGRLEVGPEGDEVLEARTERDLDGINN